jgi:hypothetical protein
MPSHLGTMMKTEQVITQHQTTAHFQGYMVKGFYLGITIRTYLHFQLLLTYMEYFFIHTLKQEL